MESGKSNVTPHRIPNPPRVRNTVKAIVRNLHSSLVGGLSRGLSLRPLVAFPSLLT
jgi:hypothetical protein